MRCVSGIKALVGRGARLGLAAVVATALLGLGAEQALAGAVISNGTVALGVNDTGQLNFSDGERYVGVTYEATGNDGTRAGCPCEGWGAGVADPGGDFSGFADNNLTGSAGSNLDLIGFTSTASSATSVVSIDDKLKVTHAFAPSPSTPNLYEIKVTLENIGAAALPHVRYTRLMDWDIEPTAFSEFVTIQGADPQPDALIHSNDNGFASPDPFAAHPPLDPATENADYIDKGPADHGALFDFDFGALAVGAKKEFSIFYGAAGTETAANAAVSAVGAELYSYGQPNGGQVTGEPNTFIWGFKAVGGEPAIPPTLTLSPKTATNPVGVPHTATAELKDSLGNPVPGASIVFEVSGANPQPAAARTTGSDGKATSTYTGTSAGDDAIRACLDNNGNGACDEGEVTDTASKTWTAEVHPTLRFLTQPTDARTTQTITGSRFDPAGAPVAVELVDGEGGRLTSSTASVTLAIGTNPGGGVLAGTKTVSAVNGVATFTSLSIDKPGVGYTLSASSPGATSAVSDPFAIQQVAVRCPEDVDCVGVISLAATGGGSSVQVTAIQGAGADVDTGFLTVSVGLGGPLDCAGYQELFAASDVVTVDFTALDREKQVVATIGKRVMNAAPNNGAAFLEQCFAAPYRFATKLGTPLVVNAAYVPGPYPAPEYKGLLPDCGKKAQRDDPATPAVDGPAVRSAGPPCVLQRKKSTGGDGVIVSRLPAGSAVDGADPRFRS